MKKWCAGGGQTELAGPIGRGGEECAASVGEQANCPQCSGRRASRTTSSSTSSKGKGFPSTLDHPAFGGRLDKIMFNLTAADDDER